MHNCQEKDCKYQSEKKGFCPDHGKELVASGDAQLNEILGVIKEVVKDQVKESMKDHGSDKKIFSGASGNRAEMMETVKGMMPDVDKKHYETLIGDAKEKFLSTARIAYFFKNIVAFGITHDQEFLQNVKALSTTDGAGGYTIPQEFRAELVRDMLDKPFLRNLVTVIPMANNYLELPTLLSDVKVSWGSENTAISTTTARFGQLTFTPYRLNTFLYTSRELVNDSALNIVQLISRLFSEAIGREEDRVIVNGSGTGQPKGIMTETLSGIDNNNTDADLAGNVKKLPFLLGKQYRQNGRWLVNSIAMGALATLRDTSSGVFLLGGLADGSGTRLAGYPVEECNDLYVDTLVFGDLSQYYLADREQMSVETTTEGAGTFEKHQVAIKVVERIDGKVAVVNAFRALTNAGIL